MFDTRTITLLVIVLTDIALDASSLDLCRRMYAPMALFDLNNEKVTMRKAPLCKRTPHLGCRSKKIQS